MPIRLALLVLALFVALSTQPAVHAAPKDGPDVLSPGKGEPINLRPQYKVGQTLTYCWDIKSNSSWLPKKSDTDWAQSQVAFNFDLACKAVRDNGHATFDVNGHQLKAEIEGEKGKIGIDATDDKAKILLNGNWVSNTERTPLQHEVTVTMDERFRYRYGTGLRHLALYFAHQVDGRFWTMLTAAPDKPVRVGQEWQDSFEMPIPGASTDKPLQVDGRWKVVGWTTFRGQKVLSIALAARLKLDDTDVTLRNGDRVHLVTGSFEAQGQAYWHPQTGILMRAAAEQSFNAKADRPNQRMLKSHATSVLELKQAR